MSECTYNLFNRINSSAVPLVRTVLHKNSFVTRMLSQTGAESFYGLVCLYARLFVCYFYVFNIVNVICLLVHGG